MAEATEIVAPGRILGGRYEILQALASGGMAQVWIANDMQENQSVAIKILHHHLTSDQKFISRFRREAEAAYKLSHNSIVAIYDTISERNVEAIVMEFIEGETLRDRLDKVSTLTPAEVISIGSDISDGLYTAHKSGIIHRDIKPANIMLCPDGRVVITDFGIAKAEEDTDLTATGMLLGTAKYLAPEQVTGNKADPRSDIYSLAVVLYESLTGEPPFKAETEAATALARLQNPAPRISSKNPKLSGELEELIAKALEKDINNRHQDANEFTLALKRINKSKITRSDPLPKSYDGTFDINPYGPSPTTALAVQNDAPSFDRNSKQDLLSNRSNINDSVINSGGPLSTNWVVPIIGVFLFIGAFIFAIALLINSLTRGEDTESTTINVPVQSQIAQHAILDPEGDEEENIGQLIRSYDNNSETVWRSETYTDPDIDTLKGGIRLLYQFEEPKRISQIEIDTPTTEWKAVLHFYQDSTNPIKSIPIEFPLEDNTVNVDIESVKVFDIQILNTGTTDDEFVFQLNEVSIN